MSDALLDRETACASHIWTIELNGIDILFFMLYEPVSLYDGLFVYAQVSRSILYPVLIVGSKYVFII